MSLGFFEQSEGTKISKEQEKLLEELHYCKIDISDEIVVINFNVYLGNSTRKEIDYAKSKGKGIRYYSDITKK